LEAIKRGYSACFEGDSLGELPGTYGTYIDSAGRVIFNKYSFDNEFLDQIPRYGEEFRPDPVVSKGFDGKMYRIAFYHDGGILKITEADQGDLDNLEYVEQVSTKNAPPPVVVEWKGKTYRVDLDVDSNITFVRLAIEDEIKNLQHEDYVNGLSNYIDKFYKKLYHGTPEQQKFYSKHGLVMESETPSAKQLLIESNEADQLSTALKNIEVHTKLDKESLSQIYLTFIKMDKNKFDQPLPDIFQKLKVMLVDLLHGKTSIEEILKYLNQYI
jgi:hypothetical protein